MYFGFLIKAVLLNIYFSLHYHSWFHKEIYFFEYLYFSEYDIQMSLYSIGWERGHQLGTYATGGRMGVHRKCIELSSEGGGATPHVYVRTCTLFMFWQFFCLIVSYFICRNLTLPLFKKDLFFWNDCFSPKRSISVVSFFNLKLFLQTKVSENAFKINQIES